MKAALAILVLVAACFLFGIGLLLKERWLPRRCPRCRWRALKQVGGARATKVDAEAGHASPNVTARYDRRPEAAKKRAALLLRLPYRVRAGT